MSDTPETQEAVERWRQGKINIFDEMARLERERDKAHALVAEMKQAIIWAKAEAKERLHRLDQAACERRTWLEAHEKMRRERDEARKALKDANESVVTFCALWAAQYAAEHGLPNGHLHPTHYDILQKAGARMNDFTRADLKEDVR